MTILGIESSCDETAVALVSYASGRFSVLRDLVASQAKIHAKYGGVVPEVAARNHSMALIPLIKKALGKKRPDVLAVTSGPGLITSLLVGVQTAKTLSYLWKKPMIGVNHIEGHLYANFVSEQAIRFPAVVLIVSGGHTELLLMKGHGRYELLGSTRDDAAGEAFDKGAKILGLGYPGGPALSRLAQQGDASRYPFPRPMLDVPGFEFSYSGLKTSLLYRVLEMKKKRIQFTNRVIADLCAGYQDAIVDILVSKTARALRAHSVHSLICGGGVMANSELRKRLSGLLADSFPGVSLYYPSPRLCTDNAVMIAAAGAFHAIKKMPRMDAWKKIDVSAQWELAAKKQSV